eukprot:1186671-Prorocentrum_minimum.AAC.3
MDASPSGGQDPTSKVRPGVVIPQQFHSKEVLFVKRVTVKKNAKGVEVAHAWVLQVGYRFRAGCMRVTTVCSLFDDNIPGGCRCPRGGTHL